ncbi:MAG: discoidin domain-containing protein, partial [Bacteroidota bacterium]
VGLQLCLWSFDMLRISFGETITDRSYALLTDPALTQSYIDNALIPMVEALDGHPALIGWEIFNEAEGMSDVFGWDFNRHVPIEDIQRFVNRTAGAIRRADPDVPITNGVWSFFALTDRPTARQSAARLNPERLEAIRRDLSVHYRTEVSLDETRRVYDLLHSGGNQNYYRDDRLIAAGGDPDGTLDYYNVHYYEWGGTPISPFHHDKQFWGLDKPLVVGEFYMGEGQDGNDNAVYGVPYEELFTNLYEAGYAGGLGWQWYNFPVSAEGVVNWPRMLENMATMAETYPADVTLFLGLRINAFRAFPEDIEAGQESMLSWVVSGASSVSIDGEPVDSLSSRVVAPNVTTTYTLEAISRADPSEVIVENVTINVLEPNQVNRALAQAATASTIETCCGVARTPGRAVDGNPNTRWSSEWEDGLADANPDDEWLAVDLGLAFEVERIVLDWEAAYGRDYDLWTSLDGRNWTTVHEERGSDGGRDEIVLSEPVMARYVRMQGVARATEFGYSLWEFEVYGLVSPLQPPAVQLTLPYEGAIVAPGAEVSIEAIASDPDGSVTSVELLANDTPLSEKTMPPYATTWDAVPAGTNQLTARVTDNDGLIVDSAPYPVYAYDIAGYTRYEVEAGATDGDATAQVSPGSSGRFILILGPTGTVTLPVDVATAGTYLVTLRYRVGVGEESIRTVRVNDGPAMPLRFNGTGGVWLDRGMELVLDAGTNFIALGTGTASLDLDVATVSPQPVVVSTADDTASLAFSLGQSYPNPARATTTLAYTLDAASPVRLDVFDVTGRLVTTLVDAEQASGTHTVRFDTRGLASGVYVYRLQATSGVQTRRLLVVR